MHRFPKIFSHSSERRKSRDSGSSSSSSRQAAKPKRLDRRNASKNINYECSASTSGSSSLYSSEESLRKRSVDLYGGKMSFRVDGSIAEFETICKTLGFSGIDDFDIPLEEYEAMKVRSSSAPVVSSQEFKPLVYRNTEVDGDDVFECSNNIDCIKVVDVINRHTEGGDIRVSRDLVGKKFEEPRDFSYMNRSRAYVCGTDNSELSKRSGDSVMASDVIATAKIRARSSEFRGNGIKGLRPPVLTTTPLMMRPEMDDKCSTWDGLRGFARDNDTRALGVEREIYLDEDGEGTEAVGRERSEQEEELRSRVTMREENCVLSGSCSFTTTTSIDDDSSSSTTEMMSSISPNRKFRRVIKDWQKGALLGSGSFGCVYEGIADDGLFFAVKEVSLLDQGDEGKQRLIQLEQEIALLSQFEHENIVRYYGTKKDGTHLYIFLELVTMGSLLSLYQKYDLRAPQVSAYTRQILHGLKYLHDRNVVHRDIKCANILVHTNGLVKLADFGLAKATKLNDVKSCKGTAFWMAPEVVRSQWYGLAADIWSLGCTVLEMLTRRFPYSNLECMAALYRIGCGHRPPIPDTIASDARDFILQCLQVDPSLRPTAAQLLDHPFVKRPLPSSSGTSSPQSFGRQI